MTECRPRRPPYDASDAVLMASDTEEAFAEVVRRYGPLVGRIARGITPGIADDVAQQTFLSAWLARGRFDAARGTLGSWLCRIARNRALDAHRIEQRHLRSGSLDAATDMASPAEGPADVADRRATSVELRGALHRISAEQRTVLTLAYYGELTQAEIQATTRAPLGTVKGRLRLGLQNMRAELVQAA